MEKQEKKNPLQKLKEGLDDKEEQLAIISLFVRLGIVVWSGFIVSLNYISLPGYSNEPKDITFPASLLTAAISVHLELRHHAKMVVKKKIKTIKLQKVTVWFRL